MPSLHLARRRAFITAACTPQHASPHQRPRPNASSLFHAVCAQNPDIFFTDRNGYRNRECLSLGCNKEPLFWGRTGLELYRDLFDAFADSFDYLFGHVISEVTIGLGPAGELRYPSYPEGDGRWRFPGVGEFQCYDAYMLGSLKKAAIEAGHPEWGYGGPHDAGGS